MTAASLAPTRQHGWTTLAELTCPNGHHIRRDAVILDHGAIRCKSQIQGRPHDCGQECGAWLYVMGSVGWSVTTDSLGREHIELGEHVYTVAVTYDELRQIRAERMSAASTLRFLGVASPTALRRRR